MSPSTRRLAVLLLLSVALPAAAQQFRWIDDKGRTQYSDRPPPSTAKNVQKTEARIGVVDSLSTTALESAVKNSPVKLYSSPNCKEGCSLVRDALNKRGVPFKEVLVWDQATNEELQKASGGNGVPVLLVGARVYKGFEQGAFDTLLDSAHYPKAGTVPELKQAAPPAPPMPGDAAKPPASGSPASGSPTSGPAATR